MLEKKRNNITSAAAKRVGGRVKHPVIFKRQIENWQLNSHNLRLAKQERFLEGAMIERRSSTRSSLRYTEQFCPLALVTG